MEVKVDVVSREVIKPVSPAPCDRHQLSLLDFYCPSVYVSTIFFYKSLSGESSKIISGRLKSSLSKTLSRFYPLAGRIEGISINCNDEGAVFTEATTDLLLSHFLKNKLDDINSLREFLPVIAREESPGTWPLLNVMVSFFGSGSGVAVTVSISHKICDATSSLTFVQSWAATEKYESDEVVVPRPQFAETTIFPPPSNSFEPSIFDILCESRSECVTNRLVFKSSKIAELKRKAASEIVPVPTRVEAISSLIWRCARNASCSNSPYPKSAIMSQALDLRLRIPSNVLSRASIGNLQSIFFLKKGIESKMEISKIVEEFRKAKEGVNEKIRECLQGYNTATNTVLGQNLLSMLGDYITELKQDIDSYQMTSWCKKPFYEVDFGWGTPVWMGYAPHITGVVYVLLIDSKNGEDVEAWVSLPKQDMLVFLSDPNLLTYAILNPPVLI